MAVAERNKRERGLCGPVMMKLHEAEKHMQPSAPEVKHTYTHTHTHAHTHKTKCQRQIRGSPFFQEAQRLVGEKHAHTELLQ